MSATAVPTTATPLAAPAAARQSGYDAMRPFALLAAIAFVVGFVGYVAFARPILAQAAADPPAVMAEPAAAGPASDDWNLPKHI
ncbi:MAG: hypothetical protein ACJ798_10350 [Phenylobacterium sp.]